MRVKENVSQPLILGQDFTFLVTNDSLNASYVDYRLKGWISTKIAGRFVSGGHVDVATTIFL